MCNSVDIMIMSLIRPLVMKENSVGAFVMVNGPAISVSRRRTMRVESTLDYGPCSSCSISLGHSDINPSVELVNS